VNHLRSFPFLRWRKRRELAPRWLLHGLRWHLTSSAWRAGWIAEHLQLDGYYWLFLVGLNNSGTTLLSRLLGTHPVIRALPNEGMRLTRAIPRSGDFDVSRRWGTMPDLFRLTEADDGAPAARIQYDWAFHVPPRPGIILEKSPVNSLRSRWYQAHFQPCRFLILVRSPYGVCEGTRRRQRVAIDVAARHWAAGNRYLLEDRAHLERWLMLTYEAFCADPAGELRRIEEFLGLARPIDRRLLATPLRAPNIHGQPAPIQDMNPLSLQRLSADDIATINRHAGPVMRELGYELLNPETFHAR
jgi:hypothetical protein